MLDKTKWASIALGAVLLLANTGIAQAGWSEGKCRSKIQKEQRDVERAEYRFGPNSPQAFRERQELRHILDKCSYYRGYYGYRDGFYRDRW